MASISRPTQFKCVFGLLALYVTSTLGSLYMLFPLTPLLFANRLNFHAVCDFGLRVWFGLAVFVLERVCGIKICVHESERTRQMKKTQTKEEDSSFRSSSIVLMNHRTRLDWLFYFCVLYRLNGLTNIKIILKDELKKIPGPGWAMQYALFIFIRRKWEMDRLTLTSFLEYFALVQKKVHMLIYPEGTNLTKETLKKSDKFAAANGLEPYSQVLYPRTTGFIHIFNEMKRLGSLKCVQDVTVAYRGEHLPVTELDFLSGKLPKEIHFYLDTIETNHIIQDPTATSSEEKDKCLEKWLMDRWALKEKFLVKFYENEEKKIKDDDELSSLNDGVDYKLRLDTPFESQYLFIYPVYWVTTLTLFFYYAYTYFTMRLLVMLALGFFFGLQLFGQGIDHMILNVNREDNTTLNNKSD